MSLLRLLSSTRFWLLLFALWLLGLIIASSLSSHPSSIDFKFPHVDKIAHFAYFLSGSFLFSLYYACKKGKTALRGFTLLFIIILFAAIGILDEYHQSFTPGRQGNDFYDWLADVCGSIAGIFAAKIFPPFLTTLLEKNSLKSEKLIH